MISVNTVTKIKHIFLVNLSSMLFLPYF